MSAQLVLRAAMIEALRGDATLGALVNQIADGEPPKASPPWLQVGLATSATWGARGVEGETVRQTIELAVRGDQSARVDAIADRVDAVLGAMPDALGDWRVTSLHRERVRTRKTQAEWRSIFDYSVRLVRIG